MQFKKYLPEFVYGSIDGTVTTFAIVSGIAGAALSPGIVLILGISNVLADGFSMASSNFLSERSRDHHNVSSAFKTALVTFVSFVTIGFIPILPYLLRLETNNLSTFQFSCIFTGLIFLFIGVFRAKISGDGKIISATETVIIGTVAASIAYCVGYFLKGLV